MCRSLATTLRVSSRLAPAVADYCFCHDAYSRLTDLQVSRLWSCLLCISQWESWNYTCIADHLAGLLSSVFKIQVMRLAHQMFLTTEQSHQPQEPPTIIFLLLLQSCNFLLLWIAIICFLMVLGESCKRVFQPLKGITTRKLIYKSHWFLVKLITEHDYTHLCCWDHLLVKKSYSRKISFIFK